MPTPFALVDHPAASRRAATELLTRSVPPSLHDLRIAAPSFTPDAQLQAAVNVALAVGAPLLVTGEPGCGKTQLAYWLAWYFQVPDSAKPEERQPFLLPVKSTTVARDLLYRFDTVRYFHASADPRRKDQDIPPVDYVEHGPLWRAFLAIKKKSPAIVLIDEIDKAPRDFPNDLLHELDQYEFRCHEASVSVSRPEGSAPPLVIITSNSERRLPEPFLRRCIFHHMVLTKETVAKAVDARCALLEKDLKIRTDLRAAAQAQFWALRDQPGLRKTPGLGELLTWLVVLALSGAEARHVESAALGALDHLGVLLKDREDVEAVRGARRT